MLFLHKIIDSKMLLIQLDTGARKSKKKLLMIQSALIRA